MNNVNNNLMDVHHVIDFYIYNPKAIIRRIEEKRRARRRLIIIFQSHNHTVPGL
jgi:hypothetical protein